MSGWKIQKKIPYIWNTNQQSNVIFVIRVNMRVASIAEKIHNTCKNDMYSKCLDDLYNENTSDMCAQSYEAIYCR